MKTTTSFTYPAFALFVLACFALSPQAFAARVATPTFSPTTPACQNSVSVTLSTTTSGAMIRFTILNPLYESGGDVANNTAITVNGLATKTKTIKAQGHKSGMDDSTWASATYAYHCLGPSPKAKIVLWVIGLILLAAVLIWLFRKWSSANR